MGGPLRRALLLGAVVLLAGCGGSEDADDPAGGEPETKLAIQIFSQGPGGPFAQWELECHPTGGSLPDAEDVCERLDEASLKAFDPVPVEAMCTEQYGGPELAKVNGTFEGAPVTTEFMRTDGCEISRWNRLEFLFPTDDGT